MERRSRQAEIFLRQAEYCDSRSPLYAQLCRALAEDERVAELAPDLRWDFPLRLLGGLHYLVLSGDASWDDVPRALEAHRDFLARFAGQTVQTNEVARAWALLPGLLSLGAPRVDLVELGTSAGLLLALDDYDYRYRAGSWGRGADELVLRGDDRGGPPASLLSRSLVVGRRIGIDVNPIVPDEDGARLLEAFVWPDQHERVERLRRAVELARRREIELVRGDYVDVLPAVLEQRRDDALTVVLSSVSTVYLGDERYEELLVALARAGTRAPLAWVALEAPRNQPDYGATVLEVTTWPRPRPRRLAKVDFHAQWLEWL